MADGTDVAAAAQAAVQAAVTAHAAAQAVVESVTPDVPVITATSVIRETPSRGGAAFQSPCIWTDNGQNLFLGLLQAFVDPANTVYRVYKYTNGARVAQWNVIPPDGFKCDYGIFSPVGDKVVVALTSHGPADPTTGTRPLDLAIAEIPGVFVPYGNGQMPAGGIAVIPGGTNQGDSGMTVAEYVAELQNHSGQLYTLLASLVKNNARVADEMEAAQGGAIYNLVHSIDPDVMQALVNIWDKNNPDPVAQTFQARFDQDVRDRAYEAIRSYLPK